MLKTPDVMKKLHCVTHTELAQKFKPPITKQAVQSWGDRVPLLREYQLREQFPELFPSKARKSR